jgi:hypothetical protein
MPSRSSFRSLAALALMPTLVSSACSVWRRDPEAVPSVPTVASIPVAPLPPPPAPAEMQMPAAISAEIGPPAPAVDEPAPPAAPAPQVVLVDEMPYRWFHAHASDGGEYPRRHSHPHRHAGGSRQSHPAPGIVVDVTDAQNGANASELQRTARSAGYWPFRRCYEEGLRRDQRLAGRVSLQVSVAANGGIERASVASATLRDESVVLCVAREASRLVVASCGSMANAKMEVTLSTGDEAVPMPRPVPGAEELRSALRESWPAVKRCYATELARRPDAGGRLELKFRTTSSGEIVDVAEQGETRFAEVAVTRCVLGVYRTTALPAVRIDDTRETSFVYAMHLEAKRD